PALYCVLSFVDLSGPPPAPTLFPYTTLFRSALEGGDGPKDGQRLWLEVDDPDLAETWLLDLIGWTQRVLAHLAQTEIPQCWPWQDRKSTRLNSSHVKISYAVFCLKKKTIISIFSAPKTVFSHRNHRSKCGQDVIICGNLAAILWRN